MPQKLTDKQRKYLFAQGFAHPDKLNRFRNDQGYKMSNKGFVKKGGKSKSRFKKPKRRRIGMGTLGAGIGAVAVGGGIKRRATGAAIGALAGQISERRLRRRQQQGRRK